MARQPAPRVRSDDVLEQVRQPNRSWPGVPVIPAVPSRAGAGRGTARSVDDGVDAPRQRPIISRTVVHQQAGKALVEGRGQRMWTATTPGTVRVSACANER